MSVIAQVGTVTATASKAVSDRRLTGALFMFGSMLFLLLTTISESIYPDFSLRTNAISDLAAVGTSTTIIEETAILGLGVCWTLGAYYLFRSTGRTKMMILYLLPGLGFLLAGLSPENVNVVIHSIGAPLAFGFGAGAAMLSYRMIRSEFRYFSIALGALSLASTLVIFIGGQLVGPCGSCPSNMPGYIQRLEELGLGLGGWESMIIYPLLVWLIGFGSHLLTTSHLRGET
jgi:hypothetical membrane protein